ncbi:Cholinesterase [Pseudocercospora fuligena]|uniref:Cholinesterase n=1 Tax=Pseudocercospora fuligena TaxID=685502 RepID=A0A8H6RBM6_9PEZI|nr:Cholinesterase [Pseudocercospora fuligena]
MPFAKPPTGELRWLPPQKPDGIPFDRVFDATHLPPSCPQYFSTVVGIYSDHVPQYLISGPMSEDCLQLSIWTPTNAQNLPVLFFITGGGFQVGGVDIPYQLPHHWVQRTQAHIVVTINYRMNIFGFPHAEGLEDQNLAILDQRAALEWLRDNIKAFGGDPHRITMYGQSAGGVAVDYHIHAFADDPIVTGYFGQSGTAFLPVKSNDLGNTISKFSHVAASMNCSRNDPMAELQCMRGVPWETLNDFVGAWAGESGTSIPFNPVVDNKIVFEDYDYQYHLGKMSRLPAIFSTTRTEGNSFVPFAPEGVNETLAKQLGDFYFHCPTAYTTKLRQQAGLKTYRYVYSGNFSNNSPLPWMGAFHGSDLPMVFGTHEDFENGGGHSTLFEYETAIAMQDMLLAFMIDPQSGLERKGWPSMNSGLALDFGRDGTIMQNITLEQLDSDCH